MNYTIRSINPISQDILHQNDVYNDEFDEEQGDYEPVEILGTPHRLEIETTHDDCLVVLAFLCGAKSGVQLEQTQANAVMLDAYTDFPVQELIETLIYEFPTIINHNTYAEHAEKATNYLQSIRQHAVQNGTAVHIELTPNLLINLTRKDILYFADLEDEINTKEN